MMHRFSACSSFCLVIKIWLNCIHCRWQIRLYGGQLIRFLKRFEVQVQNISRLLSQNMYINILENVSVLFTQACNNVLTVYESTFLARVLQCCFTPCPRN